MTTSNRPLRRPQFPLYDDVPVPACLPVCGRRSVSLSPLSTGSGACPTVALRTARSRKSSSSQLRRESASSVPLFPHTRDPRFGEVSDGI
jgi:hypothetical protein